MSVRVRPDWPLTDHMLALTDQRGIFEHALYAEPRREHGYCLDDVARALVVVCSEADPGPMLVRAADTYLAFVVSAVAPDGSCHNRMDAEGSWTDTPGTGDWWGRALWGLGVASARAPTEEMRAVARTAFCVAARARSGDLRPTVFAALGAGELVLAGIHEAVCRRLLGDLVTRVGARRADAGWPWPEARLTYANGAVVEALLLAGAALPDVRVTAHALHLLRFLLDTETAGDRLSVTPSVGRGPGERGPRFDQQPIEVAALAAACARAFALTRDPAWRRGVALSWAWFRGRNDVGAAMFEPGSGGGFDGLQRTGANQNRGAESTLALLATAQLARGLGISA